MRRNSKLQETAGTELNLKKLYPVSGLIDFRKTFWLLGATMTLSLVAAVVNLMPPSFLSDPNTSLMITNGVRVLAFALACCWFVKFIYECLRRHSLYYGIFDGHLIISQGIILKQRGFFPLSRITDIYLERSPLDLLFGLHTLHISTPTSLSERFARIEGLSLPVALALQQLLSSVLEHAEERSAANSNDFSEDSFYGNKGKYMSPTPGFAAVASMM